MEIKRITLSDLEAVVPLFDQYRMFYKQASAIGLARDFLRARLENNESVIFMAFENAPIGFVQLYPKYSSMRAVKNWILNDLYVDEHCRKKGVGTALIATAQKFAQAEKAQFLQLETATDNYTAQNLYESLGFIQQKPDEDFLVYRLTIS